ncbi:MAG: tetratricopeptide repeat protein [Kofleriaceae bacterium]
MKYPILILLHAMLFFGLAARGPVARADDLDTRTARRHFDKADKLFALGRFDQALEQYQKAYDAKPIPDFLFNIGQCYRNLNDYESAIFSFRKFLTLDPETPRRADVEQLIEELEAKKARADVLERESRLQAERAPPPRSTPITKRWWFWTGVVAFVGAGAGTAYLLTREDGVPASDLGNINFPK